jgi:hypothetical protein
MANPIVAISEVDAHPPAATTSHAPSVSLQPLPPAPAQFIPKQDRDTVELSIEARARLLNAQGQSPNEIATNLNVTPKDVVSYLGITQLEAEIAALGKK